MAEIINAQAPAGAASEQIDPVPRISMQVFCDSEEIGAVVDSALKDRRMAKTHSKQHMGGSVAAVEAYRGAATPNVIVIEAPKSRDTLIDQLDQLAHYCDPGTKVVVLGHANDISLYRDLMARGVSEYLVAPFGPVDFVRAISRLYRGPDAKPLGRVVAVIGAKGGVGSSTVAHNIAWTMATKLDMATVIADCDLPFGTAGLDYNQDPPQGIAEAVFAPDRVDANLIERLLSKCGDKLGLLAAPATLERQYDFTETSFDTIIDVLRQTTPWIVLDVPHQWSGWTRRQLVGADELVIVATPDLASLRNAKNIVDNLKSARPHDHPPKLVVNGVGLPKRPEISIGDFCKTVGLEAVATIAHDAKTFGGAANNGQMIAEADPKNPAAQTFLSLASLLAGRADVRQARKAGLLDPIMSRLQRRSA